MKKDPELCNYVVTINTIVGKWKVPIISNLINSEALRFNELRRLIPDITQRMLTLHLRELEQQDIIKRVIYPQIPPKVEYSITEYGKSLEPIINSIAAWGASHQEHMRVKNSKQHQELQS